jgi:hypothetical chaperone protein
VTIRRPDFGRAALAAYLEGEEGRLLRGLKSTLGSGLINDRTAIGGSRAISFRDVLARFIGHLRLRLDQAARGSTAWSSVGPCISSMTTPQPMPPRKAVLEEIGRACGFREVEFQYEPVAAALHYEQGLGGRGDGPRLRYRRGHIGPVGLRLSPGRAKAGSRGDILANDGIRVGGTDFDRLLCPGRGNAASGLSVDQQGGRASMPRHYWQDMATWHRINALYAPRAMADLKGLRH